MPPTPPANTTTISTPLLAILVSLLLACAGWANSLRQDVSELKSWKEAHQKQTVERLAEIRGRDAELAKQQSDNAASFLAQTSAINETLTAVRIEQAARK